MLWSVGRFDLRLSEEEFWHLVPRQFVALMKRRRMEIVRKEFAAGIVCSAIFSSRGVKTKPTDFMPTWKQMPESTSSWQEMRSKVLQAAAAIGGVQ